MLDERQQLDTTRARLVQAQSVLQQRHAWLVQFSQQWAEHARQIEAAGRTLAEQRTTQDEAEKRLAAERQQLQAECAAYQERCDALATREAELTELDRELAERASRLHDDSTELHERNAHVEAQEQQLRLERDQLEARSRELTQFREELEAQRDGVGRLAEQLDLRGQELDDRAHGLAAERAASSQEQAALALARYELDAQRQELAAAQAAFESDKARQQEELDRRSLRVEDAVRAASEQRAEVERERERVWADAELLAAERARFESSVDEHEHELAVCRREIDEARSELDEQVAGLASELEQLRNWGEQLARQAAELEDEAGRLSAVGLPTVVAPPSQHEPVSAPPRESALRVLRELEPAKAAGLLLAYVEAGVAALSTETVSELTAIADLLKADGRAAVARAGRSFGVPAAVAVAAALLSRRKLDLPLELVETLPWPVIDELLDRRAIGVDEALRLGAQDVELVRARLGDVDLPLAAVERVGWTSEAVRRLLAAETVPAEAAGPVADLVRALRSAESGNWESLASLNDVPAEYEVLVGLARELVAAAAGVAVAPALVDDTSLWPLLHNLFALRRDLGPSSGPFASWHALLVARRFVRIGDLQAARQALGPALQTGSDYEADAWMLAAYLAVRDCDGDTAMDCLERALAADGSLRDAVEHNRTAVERARTRSEWISPYAVLGLDDVETPSAAGRAWGARLRDARLLDLAAQADRKADLNWALQVIEAGTNEPWFRVSTAAELPVPPGPGLLRPEPRPLPRFRPYTVEDVHAAAKTWFDQLLDDLLAGSSMEQRTAQDA